MHNLKDSLKLALKNAVSTFGVPIEIIIQEVPENKPGDYGSPIAFSLAKNLGKNPVTIAQEIVAKLEIPEDIEQVNAVGPYINFHVDRKRFIKEVIESDFILPSQNKKVIVEHTSVNPNKEAHVGHLRNIVLGDACSRILKAAGYEVEVQNYIDDTGRQAAESLFAIEYFSETYDGSKKYDHWLGELYVRLGKAKKTDAEVIEKGVSNVMHELEQGKLRTKIEEVVRAQLETCYALGVEYDLLVWESDVVAAGFLEKGLEILKSSPYVSKPVEGKYAGATIMDVSEFIPDLSEPNVVLVRSDGNAVYVTKDIGYHFWKIGLFQGLKFQHFTTQSSGKELYSSISNGEANPNNENFAGGNYVNVIDVRQIHPQTIVKTALTLSQSKEWQEIIASSQHLAYEVVTLEGQPMSGRKGITLAIDTVIGEATDRVKKVILEKNPDLPNINEIARQIGIGTLRFSMLKNESKKKIDFRWEQALSLQGDSAPYVQFAHARASSILRKAKVVDTTKADWSKLGKLELKLAQEIARVPEVILNAARNLAPHQVAQYTLDLATVWNSYFNHKDDKGNYDTQVLTAEEGLKEARLALVSKVKKTLAYTLDLLGVVAPEEM